MRIILTPKEANKNISSHHLSCTSAYYQTQSRSGFTLQPESNVFGPAIATSNISQPDYIRKLLTFLDYRDFRSFGKSTIQSGFAYKTPNEWSSYQQIWANFCVSVVSHKIINNIRGNSNASRYRKRSQVAGNTVRHMIRPPSKRDTSTKNRTQKIVNIRKNKNINDAKGENFQPNSMHILNRPECGHRFWIICHWLLVPASGVRRTPNTHSYFPSRGRTSGAF